MIAGMICLLAGIGCSAFGLGCFAVMGAATERDGGRHDIVMPALGIGAVSWALGVALLTAAGGLLT